MNSIYKNIHPKFKLNGISYTNSTLKKHALYVSQQQNSYAVSIGLFLLDWLDRKSTVEVRTSGSTGVPKKIVLEKKYMVNSALATGEFFGLKAGETALHCLPTNFIAGKMMLVRAMVLGLEIECIYPGSNPLENCNKTYDFCAMVPLQVQNSLSKINQLKTLLVGGAPISVTLKNKLQNSSTKVFETYGMTETITHIAAKKVNLIKESSKNVVTEHSRSENNFHTLPKVSISKDNRDCLVITAPNVSNHTIVTNDIVNIISKTEFEWLGRYDSVINSGGVKLIPEQIEAKLAAVITNRFFVAGLPDAILGEKLILIIEGDIDIAGMHQKIKELKTPQRFEIPKEIYCVDSFLETKNGKVQRTKTIALLSK